MNGRTEIMVLKHQDFTIYIGTTPIFMDLFNPLLLQWKKQGHFKTERLKFTLSVNSLPQYEKSLVTPNFEYFCVYGSAD